MHPTIGSKVKDKQARSWIPALQQLLYSGEDVIALSRTNLLKPMADGLCVTTARVIAFGGANLQGGQVAVQALADNILSAGLQKRFMGRNCLILSTRDGQELNFGDIPADDAQMVLATVERLAATGIPPTLHRAASDQVRAAAEADAAWSTVRVVGNQPNTKTWKAIREHAMPGEVPWFVVGAETAGGALVAFADRCMIVKVGAMTSMMAGSFGGGRITTFPYGEITGIEYNAGMMSGVLEILTPSYQGSANKDYWRGTFKSVNSDSNNPWALSNTLPIGKPIYQQALPLLNEMRAKIADAKRPTIVMNGPPSAQPASGGGGLADEIGKLAALRDQGVLSEQEFQAAKQAAIVRATG
jgi:hypothetical protein